MGTAPCSPDEQIAVRRKKTSTCSAADDEKRQRQGPAVVACCSLPAISVTMWYAQIHLAGDGGRRRARRSQRWRLWPPLCGRAARRAAAGLVRARLDRGDRASRAEEGRRRPVA